MDYLADTVTVIRHFSGLGKIGRKAGLILSRIERGEDHGYISVISLVEILYLSEKKRIAIDLNSTTRRINESDNYSLVDLTPQIIHLAGEKPFPEIFDRLLLATAQFLAAPLITSDSDIRKSGLVQTIWS